MPAVANHLEYNNNKSLINLQIPSVCDPKWRSLRTSGRNSIIKVISSSLTVILTTTNDFYTLERFCGNLRSKIPTRGDHPRDPNSGRSGSDPPVLFEQNFSVVSSVHWSSCWCSYLCSCCYCCCCYCYYCCCSHLLKENDRQIFKNNFEVPWNIHWFSDHFYVFDIVEP